MVSPLVHNRISLVTGLKNYFNHADFVRNVLTLMTGATIAQAIPIVISPIITRLYAPDDFGVLALFSSVVVIFSLIATGQYEMAVMLPENDEDSINIVAISIIIAFCLSTALLIFILFFNGYITTLFGNPAISTWLYFTPLAVLLSGIYQTLNYWLNRKKQYKRLALTRISQTTVVAGGKLGMGFAGFGAGGLVLSSIMGQSVATMILGAHVWRNDKEKITFIEKNMIKHNARKHQDFPKFNAAQAFLDGFRKSGIVFFISSFFGLTTLGYYYLSVRIIQMPLSLIGSSVSQVFYQKIAVACNSNQNIWPMVKKVMLRLGIISIPMFLVIVVAGPEIFSFIFGSNWREAGAYAQILSPWLFIAFITSPISTVPLVVNKLKPFLFIGIGNNLLTLGIFILASLLGNDITKVLWAVSTFGSVYLVGVIMWVRKISK